MSFHLINKSDLNRLEHFEHFTNNVPCTFSITANINITNLIYYLKTKNIKLYPFLIYSISYLVNSNEFFRLSKENNSLGYFEILNPSYTIFNKETNLFSNIWTEYNDNFDIFYENYLLDFNKFSNTDKLSPKGEIKNCFNISCIPWVSFTSFNLNIKNSYDYLIPIFTIGKYFNDEEKILLPLCIQANHSVLDGYHIATFFNNLETFISLFVEKNTRLIN